MTRLEELRVKFGRVKPKTEEQDWKDWWENQPEQIEYRKNLAKWEDLTKDWSEEDREWAWRFIAGASQPRG